MEFFTWETLATLAGASLLTGLITQLLKEVGFIQKIPTQIFSWLVAVVVLIAATAFMGNLTLDTGLLCVVNAVVVSLSANGGYELITRKAK